MLTSGLAIWAAALLAAVPLDAPGFDAWHQTMPEPGLAASTAAAKKAERVARNAAPYFDQPEFRDSVLSTLTAGFVAYGFEEPLPEAVAVLYERAGDIAMANAARLGGDFLSGDGEAQAGAIAMLLEQAYESRAPRGLALDVEGNLAAAAAYFKGRGASVPPNVAVFFGFLARKFALDWARDVAHSFLARSAAPELRAWRRLIEPADVSAPELQSAVGHEPWVEPENRDMLNALYCDRVPLRHDFFARLFWMSARGGYDLTHAAIALAWAQEQGCIAQQGLGEALRAAQVSRMLTEADAKTVADDLFFELIAVLHYVGAGPQVEQRWLTRIVQAQRPDGSWAGIPGGGPSDHATFLAYWALLEAGRGDAPPAPMIP